MKNDDTESICPQCERNFKLEWQLYQGPCKDNLDYCDNCVVKKMCGCDLSCNKHIEKEQVWP